MIAHDITARAGNVSYGVSSDCFDRSGEGVGTTAGERSGLGIVEEASPALRAKRPNAVAFGGNDTRGPIDIATAVRAKGGTGHGDFESETFIAFDTTQITHPENRCRPEPGDPYHPLASRGHPPAIAFSCKDHGADVGEIAPTLRAMPHDKSHENGGGQVAVAFADIADPVAANQARTYTREGSNNFRMSNVATTGSAVRRLTPRECERLQGFPDDFTMITYRGKPAKDGPRYRALGNSMAVPVVRWILQRIEAMWTLNE